jgi:hypothetical protein
MKTDISRTSSLSFNPKGVSGQQSRRVQSWGRGKYGAANRGRSLTPTERAEAVKQMHGDDRFQEVQWRRD